MSFVTSLYITKHNFIFIPHKDVSVAGMTQGNH